MKRTTFLLFALVLGGCVSVGDSPSARFYMLSSHAPEAQPQKIGVPKGTIIEVGPVKIPDYQNRPQIVTQDAANMLTIAECRRWGESLDTGMERVICENLAWMLPDATVMMFPSNYAIPVNYQVMADVIQLQSRLDGELLFVAQWSVVEPANNKMLFTKRSEFRRDILPHDYSGLSDALSSVCLLLSSQIAEKTGEIAAAGDENKRSANAAGRGDAFKEP